MQIISILEIVTAVVAAAISYVSFAASSNSVPSTAIHKSQRLESKSELVDVPQLDNGVKARQWFLLGISSSCLVRLFCEVITLYLEEFPTVDDETENAVAIASQLLPAQCYCLIYSYLASYFMRIHLSLYGHSCLFLHSGWFAINVIYFVSIVFCVVLKPWSSIVFGFISVYFSVIFFALIFHGFGIARFVGSVPAGHLPLNQNKMEKRLRPLLYISCCATLLSTAFYACLFEKILPA